MVSPALQGGILTTGPPGKPRGCTCLFSPKWWPASPELCIRNPCVMLDAVLFILCPSCPLSPPPSCSVWEGALAPALWLPTGCGWGGEAAAGDERMGGEGTPHFPQLTIFGIPHLHPTREQSSPQAAASPSSYNAFSPLALQPCGSNGSGGPTPSLWFPITLPPSL